MQSPDGSTVRRCSNCEFVHGSDGADEREVCRICGSALGPTA